MKQDKWIVTGLDSDGDECCLINCLMLDNGYADPEISEFVCFENKAFVDEDNYFNNYEAALLYAKTVGHGFIVEKVVDNENN